MWISGELAGHHVDLPYDPEGFEELRKKLLKDFVQAPAADAFRTGGPIQAICDLNAAMENIGQTPARVGGSNPLPRPIVHKLRVARIIDSNYFDALFCSR
jgi:hypothetical protein